MKPHSLSHKIHAVRSVRARIAAGERERQACRNVGVPLASYQNWSARMEEAGDAGLLPRYRNCGRKRSLPLTDEEKLFLRRCSLECNGSVPEAVRRFLVSSACLPETRRVMEAMQAKAERQARKHVSWPLSIRCACACSVEEHENFRGPRAMQHISVVERRGNFIRMEDGSEIQMEPGFIYESDDMSSNENFRFYDGLLQRENLGRQMLVSGDVGAAYLLGHTCIGRDRDSYNREDQADHVWDIARTHGMPRHIWRIERGRWDNSFWWGLNLKNGRTWGGIHGNLCHVAEKFTSRGKGLIEERFDVVQRFLAHRSTSIGRHRGEFEAAKKLAMRAENGDPDALRYFWTIADCADVYLEQIRAVNGTLMERRIWGHDARRPEDEWLKASTTPVPDAVRWYFCPVKKEATVRSGVIETAFEKAKYQRSFRFVVHGVPGMPVLPSGHKVLIAFHPARPQEGCHVFNATEGTMNRDGMAFGERIGVAEWMDDTRIPQEDLSGAADHSRKARASAAVRREFRAIVPRGTGPGTLKSHAQDHMGRQLTVATGRGSQPDPVNLRRDPLDMPEATDRSAISHPQSAIRNPPSAIALRALEDAALEHLSVL